MQLIPQGIRFKLVLPLTAAFLAIMALFYLVWLPAITSYHYNLIIGHHRAMIDTVGQGFIDSLHEGDLAAIHETLDYQMSIHNRTWRQIILEKPDGKRLYPLLEPAQVSGSHIAGIRHVISRNGQDLAVLRLSVDLENEYLSQQAYIDRMGLMTLAAFGLILLGTIMLQNESIRRPLKQLEYAARRLARGDYSVELPAPGSDEIGNLNRAFADMRHDLSESQTRLVDSEYKYRKLFETSSDAVMILGSGTFIDCNPATLAMFGCGDVTEFLGKRPSELSPPLQPDGSDSGEAAGLRIQTAYVQGTTRFEWMHRRIDGEDFPAEVTLTPMELQGVHVLQAIVRDITEQKRIEQDLLLSKEQADRANLTKSEFISRMSHELRTPLNAIIGFSQLLRLRKDTGFDEQQQKRVSAIEQAGKHLLSLVDDVLDLSRIEIGQLRLDLQPVECLKLLEDSFLFVKAMPIPGDVSIEMEGPNCYCTESGPESCFIMTDPVRLKQVLVNLMTNAVKYNRVGGRVIIRCDAADNNRVRISIRDTGIGIPANRLKDVFQPFNRLNIARDNALPGVGIGLSLSKQLVEMMGGKIGVESEEGKWSLFWIELPLAEHDAKAAVAEQPADYGSRHETEAGYNARVLLAEDNLVNQVVALDMLESLGCEVDVVENGELVLQQLERQQYDLIVMDCLMPVKDGYQATRDIRQLEIISGGHVPIIALTANAMTEDRERCLVSGMDDYLSKPFSQEALGSLLSKWLKPGAQAASTDASGTTTRENA